MQPKVMSAESQRFEWKEEQQRAFRQRSLEVRGKLLATERRCGSVEEALKSLERAAARRAAERQEEGEP